MNFQFSYLVSQIIKGLKSYFEKNQIEVNENFYKELTNILNIELSKPFNKQTFTPCLLYTSPSPRDRSLSRMPSSA